MLPMVDHLNLDDQATYVALAQLTQAAIDGGGVDCGVDEQGNVILMSYEDIQKNLRELQQQQQQQQQQQLEVDINSINSMQGLQVVLDTGGHVGGGEFGGGGVSTLVLSSQGVHLPAMEHEPVDINSAMNDLIFIQKSYYL